MRNNIRSKNKKELMKILEDLIEVLSLIRDKRDEYFYQKNEREAITWLNYLRSHDNKEELLSLQNEISCRLVNEYSQIPYINIDEEEINSTHKYFYKYKKYLNKYKYFNSYRTDYGLDAVRIFLLELYGIKSCEYL